MTSWRENVPSPQRLRRDAQLNRERILQAAREVFAERGLDVTLHDVARHAGLGVGTVYRRFCNRGELIDALYEENVERLMTIARDALAHDDPWQGFVQFLERTLAVMASDRGLWTMMTSSTDNHERHTETRLRFDELVSELIARAQRTGDLRPDLRPTDLPVLGVILGAGADFTHHASPHAWRRYLTIVIDGLRTDRDTPSPLPAEPLNTVELHNATNGWRPPKR